MKQFPLLLFHTVFITLLLLLITASPAAAAEGETPQITLNVYQASPGATIEITGGRFEPDIQVALMLFQNGAEIHLGTILCDDHGEFTTPLLLPAELQVGQYEFRAVDEKNRMAVASLVIVADDGGGAEDLQRQDDDGLLAPMPTFAPGASTAGSQVQAPSKSTPSEPSTWRLVWVLVIVGLGVILLLGIRRVIKK